MRKMKKIVNEIKEYKWRIIIITVILLLSTSINVVEPLITKVIIDKGLYQANIGIVIKYSILSCVFYITLNIAGYIKENNRILIQNDLNYKLWQKAIKHLSAVQINKINTKNTVELVQCIEQDISVITSVFDEGAMFAMTEILGVIGGFIGLFFSKCFKRRRIEISTIPLLKFLYAYFMSRLLYF